MSPVDTTALINTAITVLPSVIALIRGSVPAGAPQPTEEEIKAALRGAIASSEAKDEAWLKAHPV